MVVNFGAGEVMVVAFCYSIRGGGSGDSSIDVVVYCRGGDSDGLILLFHLLSRKN